MYDNTTHVYNDRLKGLTSYLSNPFGPSARPASAGSPLTTLGSSAPGLEPGPGWEPGPGLVPEPNRQRQVACSMPHPTGPDLSRPLGHRGEEVHFRASPYIPLARRRTGVKIGGSYRP
jgi:hypothetical protein